MSCRPILQEVREVGKTIKSSKKCFLWQFNLENKEYKIELYNSILSGKKKICQNGQVIYENNSYQGVFQYPFSIGRNTLSIVQHGDKFDLRINNQSFQHLYDQRLQSSHFKTDNAHGSGSQSRHSQGDRLDQGGSGHRQHREKKKREMAYPSYNPGGDEIDDDIAKAIELSKQTAKNEEKARVKEAKRTSINDEKIQPKQSKKAAPADKDDDEFDFGGGFDKFGTEQNKNQNMGGDNLGDFDFGAGSNQKNAASSDFQFGVEESKKDEKPKEEDKPVPDANAGGGDLMDLLGGAFDNPPADNNANQAQNNGQSDGLDFLNGPSNPPQQPAQPEGQAQQNQGGNVFDFNNQDPFSAQPQMPQQQQQPGGQDQQQPAEKPKFQPNLGFLSNMQQPNSNQQQMYGTYQQQQMGTNMMGNQGYNNNQYNQMGGQNQYQNQFQTQMNNGGGGNFGNPFGGNDNFNNQQQQPNFNQGYQQQQQPANGYNQFSTQQNNQFNNDYQQQNQFQTSHQQTNNQFGGQQQQQQQDFGGNQGLGNNAFDFASKQTPQPANNNGYNNQQAASNDSTPFDMF